MTRAMRDGDESEMSSKRCDKQMESDPNGVGTGRNKIKITIGRGDLGAKYECRAKNDALDEPMVSWVELDVNGLQQHCSRMQRFRHRRSEREL
ncbi:hypothetical protein RUM44_003393 [Polyplax serrata]|uniref:Ig-like domain-containing protein n=1 Tax=Polyplax serrata TaxID=468196 RepID=A0ABR1AGC0_POLSC